MNQPCRRQTAAGRFSGNLMTKVTVYFRTIRSGFNSYLVKANDPEYAYALGLISKGICFVADASTDEYRSLSEKVIASQ